MASTKKNLPFSLKRIGEELNISRRSIENCRISAETLEKIYYDFIDSTPFYEKRRLEILAGMNERLSGEVHSIRSRVKEPDHLIGKIIRGSYSNPGKYHLITAENYKKVITDLIGVRVIILDRRDWREVHKDILTMYRNQPDHYVRRHSDILTNYDLYEHEVRWSETLPACAYHAERPIAYVTSEEDRVMYSDEYLRLDSSKAHYRSIHYVIRYKEVYFELQMRSLFEEGWLEFDHRLKYPNDLYNKRKEEYIDILSNLANAADQLISYYQEEDFEEVKDKRPDSASGNKQDKQMDRDLSLEDKIRILF